MELYGPWTIVAQHQVYTDPWITVRWDDVIRPDGKPGIHSVIHIRRGVTVLALDDEGFLHLTEEFHYAVGRVTLEGVSGGIEDGEEALVAGGRELREELGIEADSWTDLGLIDPFTTNVLSPTQLYLARSLRHGTSSPEGTEQIRCVKLPLVEALAGVMDGRITHAPTCIAILKIWVKFGGERRGVSPT